MLLYKDKFNVYIFLLIYLPLILMYRSLESSTHLPLVRYLYDRAVYRKVIFFVCARRQSCNVIFRAAIKHIGRYT